MAAALSELTWASINSLFLLVTKLSPNSGDDGGGAGLLVGDGDGVGAGPGIIVGLLTVGPGGGGRGGSVQAPA